MPDSIVNEVLREIEPLGADDLIGPASRRVIDAGLPALPAVETGGRFVAVVTPHDVFCALVGRFGEIAENGPS